MESDEHTRRLQQRQRNKEAEEKFVRIARERGLMPPQTLLPYFWEPRIYVLLLEIEPGLTDVARAEMAGWGGKLVQIFVSPIDALIEGAFRAKPGLRYEVTWAGNVGCRRFLAADCSAVAALHLSWVAHAGRLLLTPDGMPCRYSRVIREAAVTSGDELERFEVDARSRAELDRVYEQVGLYAWQDTAAQCAEWVFWDESGCRAALVEKAVRAARVRTRAEIGREDYDLALFDPEFEQWHFTPAPLDAPIDGRD